MFEPEESEQNGAQQSPYDSGETFLDLGVPEDIVQGASDMGWNKATYIQQQTLKAVLADGKTNLIAQSQNGTGKTGSYSLAMLCSVDASMKKPQALCICTTRELALQSVDVVNALGKAAGITACAAVKGGQRYERFGITHHIIIGTPGTLLSKLRHKEFDPRDITLFVIDEADEMLESMEDNMATQASKIQKQLNSPRVLLFSATFPKRLRRFANEKAPNAKMIIVPTKDLSLRTVQHFALHFSSNQIRFRTLLFLYETISIGQTIIFSNSKAACESLNQQLQESGLSVSYLNSNLEPQEREKRTKEFRDGNTHVFICSDVFARGVDFPAVTTVINYDVPVGPHGEPSYETFLHRNGRTGRAGRRGVAVTMSIGKDGEELLDNIAAFYDMQDQVEHIHLYSDPHNDEAALQSIVPMIESIKAKME